MNISEIIKAINKLNDVERNLLQSAIKSMPYRQTIIDNLNKVFNTGHTLLVVTSPTIKEEIFLNSLVSATDYHGDNCYFTRFIFTDIKGRHFGFDLVCDEEMIFTPEQPVYEFKEPIFFFKNGGEIQPFNHGIKKLVVCRQVMQYGVYDNSSNDYENVHDKTMNLLDLCKKYKPTNLMADDKPTEPKPFFGAASPQDDIAIIASNIAVWLDAVDEGQPKRRVILDVKKSFNVNTDAKKLSGRNIFSMSFTKINIDRQHQDLIFYDGENSTKIDYSEFGTISWCEDYATFKMSNTDGSHVIKMRFMDSDGKMKKYTEIINKGE